MLKLKQLVQLTPDKIMKNARSCLTYVVRTIYDTDNKGVPYRKILLKSRDAKTKRETKIMTLRCYGDNKNILEDDVWLHCSCEYFQFYLEFVLFQHDSSTIINTLGHATYPVETNPHGTPHLCKHLLKAIPEIAKAKFKGKSFQHSKKLTKDELGTGKSKSTRGNGLQHFPRGT